MKRTESDRIVVRELNGDFAKRVYPGDDVTVETCRAAIDARNGELISEGMKPRSCLICCEEHYRYYSDDGTFVRSERLVSVIERYPA